MMPQAALNDEKLLADLRALAQLGRNAVGGIDRVAFSPADQAARAWVSERLLELGLEVVLDQAGNTIGRYPGAEALPPIALGSHTDSVPDGGAYDGALGVVAALACLRALRERGLKLRHPVELINFAAEEATMAGGTTGSQAMAGLYNPAGLDMPAWDGRPVRQHMREAGLAPERLLEARRPAGALAAYLELHIEQGERLTTAGATIGVVSGFVGIRRYALSFVGEANHAGTTEMARRRDALVLAAPFVTALRDLAIARGVVGTIGSFVVHPGAPNVIPGRVDLVAEIRGLDSEVLESVEAAIEGLASQSGASFSALIRKPPVAADELVADVFRAVCAERHIPHLTMPSGAGHDAMSMAAICPQGMIFVPSQGGLSHTPAEHTTDQDCVGGAEVLLAALLRLDEAL
jgi:hydantoinase/carbamoylase family amidase